MLSYVRYTVIAMSVVFLLATSVTAAMSPNKPTFIPVQRSTENPINPESVADTPDSNTERSPNQPQPPMIGPIFIEAVVPSESAPVSGLPTAIPPDTTKPAAELNPRQKPNEKQ